MFYTCRTQANAIAQATGCKGHYALMELQFHNPMLQTVPDAMHTVKVVIEHLFYLIVGKEDSMKVRQAEVELQRFGLNRPVSPVRTTRRKNVLGPAPFRITKDQVKMADQRACEIVCPHHIDFEPRAFFSKTYFKSHDWKQVCSTSTYIHSIYMHCVVQIEHLPALISTVTCRK